VIEEFPTAHAENPLGAMSKSGDYFLYLTSILIIISLNFDQVSSSYEPPGTIVTRIQKGPAQAA
jgi:hypothetical protein